MNSSWNVEELNYTIYDCMNTLRVLNGICSDTRSNNESESINH